MNTTNDGGPAFPIQATPHDRVVTPAPHPGMSLRDYFAAQVIGHSVSNLNQNPEWIRNAGLEEQARTYAENAYNLADAMIAAREGNAK